MTEIRETTVGQANGTWRSFGVMSCQLWKLLKMLLGIEAREQEKCKRFFAEYDARFLPDSVRTNPNMTQPERDGRIAAVGRVIGNLRARATARWTAAASGAVPAPADFPPHPPAADVQELSDAQLELYRDMCPDGRGGIDYVALQHCFEYFANGELADPADPRSRGPNSSFFFLFAEFAFLAIEMNQDAAEWEKVLDTFVKTQELFIRRYGPDSPPYDMDRYGPQNYGQNDPVPEYDKKRFRRIYDGKSSDELKRAQADIMRRAQSGTP